MERHTDFSALIDRQDDPLLQVEPVVSADSNTQQPQTTHGKHTAKECQCLPATQTHLLHQQQRAQAVENRSCSERGKKKAYLKLQFNIIIFFNTYFKM